MGYRSVGYRSGLQGQIAMTQAKSRNAEIGYWWVLLQKSSAAIQLFLPDTLWALPKGLPYRSCLAHGKSGGWSGKTSCVFISSQSEGRRVERGGQRHGWSFRKFHFRIYWYLCGGFSVRVHGISDRLYLQVDSLFQYTVCYFPSVTTDSFINETGANAQSP